MSARWVRAGSRAEVEAKGCVVVEADGHAVALFAHDGGIFAVDNRCPHMGFPLHRGSVDGGILTCHWHHARFDLASGGTFDPWADDIQAFPVRLDGDDVLVDVAPPAGPAVERYRKRLTDGLRQNLRLVIAKAVIGLDEIGAAESVALEVGALYGARNARGGWGAALTILTATGNLLSSLDPGEASLALYHGLSHIASETAGQPPAVLPEPLATAERRPEVFARWLRQFAEVRDRNGVERVLVTVATLLPRADVEAMVFACVTDHRYVDGGHVLDFANKAFELLDTIGWEHAPTLLPALAPRLTGGARMEESASWRHPVDLAKLLDSAFARLPEAIAAGVGGAWDDEAALVTALLGDDPAASVDALLGALASGATFDQIGGAVCLAAAYRLARFHTANELGDWITALHTFTFANAVHQALRRAPTPELLRAAFDGAMSVYLDRFLNTPAAPLPAPSSSAPSREAIFDLLNQQQSVNAVGAAVSDWLTSGEVDAGVMSVLGAALLQEDAEFHTYQCVEAGFRQCDLRPGTEAGRIFLIAVGRYLAAHGPTLRGLGQTYRFARRLHRGEAVYDG